MRSVEDLTKRDVARALLESVPLSALRAEAKSPGWSQVYRGFRPQALTRSVFVRFAHVFARDSELLASLTDTFLTSHGADGSQTREERFAYVAENAGLPDDLANMCRQLATTDLQPLPVEGPSQPETEGATTRATGESTSDPELPSFVTSVEVLDWQPPDDQVSEIQEALTVFERSLAAFIHRQLEGLHKDAWFRRGCGGLRGEWSTRANARGDSTLQPRSLLGYAFLGEYRDIMVSRTNWLAFQAYFPDKEWLERTFSVVEPLRAAGFHPGERELRLIDQVGPLKSLADISSCYDPATAERIRELFDEALNLKEDQEERDEGTVSLGSVVLSNLGDFSEAGLVGREAELSELAEFWENEFSSKISITGPGGVGKTAVLEQFLLNLLNQRIPKGDRPYPEAVIYLTAKDNYLRYMKKAPDSRRFRTARRVFEATIETLGDTVDEDLDAASLRRRVLTEVKDMPTLFALDNLETLSEEEHEEIRHFLDDLNWPHKAIITTRVNRRIGGDLNLGGLPPERARELLVRRLADHGIEIDAGDEEALNQIVEYTGALPLALVYCVNAIQNGRTISETSEAIRGQQFLNLLQFSFDSSLSDLQGSKLKILVFLAISRHSRTRREMLSLADDEDDLDESLSLLRDMSFIRPTWEEQKQNRFTIDNRMLKDYVLERAEHVLSSADFKAVTSKANVLPAQVTSETVALEVERAIAEAKRAAGWLESVQILEAARQKWGDVGRLLEQLGYYHYRLQNRPLARRLMEQAIQRGYESSEIYVHLALVLFYERDYEESLRRAETALALKARVPQAELIAGQCHVAIVERDRFLHDYGWSVRHLEEARRHLERSMVPETHRASDQRHNERARATLERTERILISLE